MKINRSVLAASALASVVGLGVVSGVSAAGPSQAQTPGANAATPHIARVGGKVSSVSANGLVLTTPKRTFNVTTNANTWVLVRTNNGCATGVLSDIKSGARVEAIGMSTQTEGSITARVVAEGRCAAQLQGKIAARAKAGANARAGAKDKAASHFGAGTIKAITGTTLTVTGAKGKEFTVDTGADTVVLNNGFASVSSLKVGDGITVLGRPEKPVAGAAKGTHRAISAYAIHASAAGTRVLIGRVQAVTGNTLTLQTPRDKAGVSIALGASTTYKTLTVTDGKATLTAATQADVKADSKLVVEARLSQDGKSGTASSVIILPAAKKATTHH